ncbi:MAG: MC/SLC25 family protein [Paenibacillus sp.]|nr:MC/SLC25 family protein [Paenibacillus sp.]
MSNESKIPKVAQDLIAGTVGGWAQVIVGQPLDTIKVRLQTQPSPPLYKNATDCFRQLVKQEGVKLKQTSILKKKKKSFVLTYILNSLKVYIVE